MACLWDGRIKNSSLGLGKQDLRHSQGFGTHHLAMSTMPCLDCETFLFSRLGHPISSLPVNTSRQGTLLSGC